MLPRAHRNVFRYLMAFLKELLKHSYNNNLTASLIGMKRITPLVWIYCGIKGNLLTWNVILIVVLLLRGCQLKLSMRGPLTWYYQDTMMLYSVIYCSLYEPKQNLHPTQWVLIPAKKCAIRSRQTYALFPFDIFFLDSIVKRGEWTLKMQTVSWQFSQLSPEGPTGAKCAVQARDYLSTNRQDSHCFVNI